MIDWSELEREALRLHARYTTEVVEPLGLCPWAEQARQSGRVHTLVSSINTPDIAYTVTLLDTLTHDRSLEVAFIVFPLLDLRRLAFSHFVADVRARDAAQRGIGETVFALADFHPEAAPDLASPERLVPFLRRTPDLTLQVVRRSALQEVRLSQDQGTRYVDVSQLAEGHWQALQPPAPPPLAARVAKNNLRTVERMGTLALAQQFENILEDRHASYFALGLPLPLWKDHK